MTKLTICFINLLSSRIDKYGYTIVDTRLLSEHHNSINSFCYTHNFSYTQVVYKGDYVFFLAKSPIKLAQGILEQQAHINPSAFIRNKINAS